jgi:hypothetical protein
MLTSAETAEEAVRNTHEDRFFRLDPYRINERIAFARNGIRYTIDRCGVSVKMTLPESGLPLAMGLPVKAFTGIAARAMELEDGSQIVSLEVYHSDPRLCVPLLIADNLDDIAADWHSWSRLLKLPMLIIRADSMAAPVREQLGMVMNETPLERRKRIITPKHRPWFLRRRKIGMTTSIEKVGAKEIIARN